MNDKNNSIPLEQEQQPQSLDKPFRGRLHDDCLYAIIEQFSWDRKTLRNLLFVNKFFFYAAVRHLYQHRHFVGGNYYKVQMLTSIVFVSFIQTRVAESLSSPNNNKTPSEIVSEVLKQFGIELNIPYLSSGIAFFQLLTQQFSTYGEIQSNLELFTPMTIDYSKLYTELRQGSIEGANIFPLKKYSGPPGKEILKEGEKTDNTEDESFKPVNLAGILMWVHYNCDYITVLAFEASTAHKFLPYATKMPSLKTLYIDRGKTMIESELEDIVSFITQNQSAFPKKKPLQIQRWDEWHYKDFVSELPAITGNDHGTIVSSLRSCRQNILAYLRPTITIYEAVKRPSVLRANDIPDFYNCLQNIETDQILELYDSDHFRSEMMETESRDKFIQKCTNLRKLALFVNHQDAFSWATSNSQHKSDKAILRLEELEVIWGSVFQAAIMALNEAVGIFSATLKKVSLKPCTISLYSLPTYVLNSRTLRSLQLQRFPAGYTIGDFPTILPHLTHMSITLTDIPSLNIGSLSNCPNLTHLEVRFGAEWDWKNRPQGEEPASHPEAGVILDANWNYPNVDYSLFPAWNLPNLKELVLEEMAAVRFNFASLPSMQKLEKLKLSAYYHSFTEEQMYEYLVRQHKPIDDSISTPMNDDLDQQSGIFGIPYQQLSLPCLSELFLRGLPSSIFCFEYIRSFPRLKQLTLSQTAGFPMDRPSMPKPINSNSKNSDVTHPNIHHSNDKPLMDSRLEQFTLRGNNKVKSRDLIRLFTVYAPFLKEFNGDYIYGDESEKEYSEFEAIKQADIINGVVNPITLENRQSLPNTGINSEKIPGQQLTSVSFSKSISEEEAKQFGIIEIFNADEYKQRGIRVYSLWSGQYIGIRDHKSYTE